MNKQVVLRYESTGGKHWVELLKDELGFTYRFNGGGGSFGNRNEEETITHFHQMVDEGFFLPDNAKTPMKRVK